MYNPHAVTREFEKALCEYTGAPYAVAVTSCTMALLLACKWFTSVKRSYVWSECPPEGKWRPYIEIPNRTYVSVPMSIYHAGAMPCFRDEDWIGWYQLRPIPVWDSARYFTSGMYTGNFPPPWRSEYRRTMERQMVCVSFHWSKTLGIGQGGAILHDSPEADAWFRRARFDGRTEGVAPKDDTFSFIGWHCYMSPRDAAEGLSRLAVLPKHNDPLPNDDYPDLSQMEIFK